MADIDVTITSGSITVVELAKGLSGFSGRSGYSGFSGANPGASGYSGFSGKSGFSGRSGYSGYSGVVTVGTSGYSGRSGYSGFSGYSGYSGYSGFSGAAGFLQYVALLTQTAANNPVPTVLANTLSGAIAWTRTTNGVYVGTLASAFTANKTMVLMTGDAASIASDSAVYGISRNDNNTLSLQTISLVDDTLKDGLMTGATVEVRVYP